MANKIGPIPPNPIGEDYTWRDWFTKLANETNQLNVTIGESVSTNTTPLPNPVTPTLYAQWDKNNVVNKVRVSSSFDSSFTSLPLGFVVFYSLEDFPNSCTIDSGNTSPTLTIGTVDIEASGTMTILSGSTESSIVLWDQATQINPSTLPLYGKYWGQYGTSQWRKATGVTPFAVTFSDPFNVAPTTGETLNWVEISWHDQRNIDTQGKYGIPGQSYKLACIANASGEYEILSWDGVQQVGGNFQITGCVRGLEGTIPIVADGLALNYFPAPGAGTTFFVIPANSFVQAQDGSWSAEMDVNITIPAGYSVSMSCCIYNLVNGQVVRSNLVPLVYGGTF